ncbi:MAG: LacI family DNA-binding transcriptional regulator [Chthoniobacteraceae bacterium]|nr:LacI family DNA-binding transcriptional regulator [Chthoniobacteraceae bacterium]
MNTPPSIRQLAAIAGVSRTTVSLALRNHPSIAAKTRARIQEIATAHGYIQDPVISSLMNKLRVGRSNRPGEKLAFLTMWPNLKDWKALCQADRNYYHYFEGARERAAMLGYDLEVFVGKGAGMTARRLSNILYTRNIRGLIIPGVPQPRGHLSLDWEHFACVALSHTVFKPDLDRVSHFHFEGMMLALRRLKQYGYKRIGYANTIDQDERGHHGWVAAYLAYQQTHPDECKIPPFFEKKWNAKIFNAWVRDNALEVVISNWLLPTDKARQAGIEVPPGVSYVSLDIQDDNLDESTALIAGVDQQAKTLGMTAVDVVVSHIQRSDFGLPANPKITHLGGVWRDGATLLKKR